MVNTLSKIKTLILYTLMVLFPVFVITSFSSPIIVSKIFILALTIIILLFISLIEAFIMGRFSFRYGKFDIAVVLLILVSIVSTFLTANKANALISPGSAAFIIFGSLLYFLSNNIINTEHKTGFYISLLISAVLVSVANIFSELKLFANISFLPTYVKDPSFSVLGGHLPTLIFLAVLIPVFIGVVIKEKDLYIKGVVTTLIAVILLGSLLSIKNILLNSLNQTRLLDFKSSWEIAIESIKNQPILGVGPGNYLIAFNKYKPINFNFTKNWNLKFSSASNFYLTYTTELGILGLGSLIVLIASYFTNIYKNRILKGNFIISQYFWNNFSLFLLLISFAFFPAPGPIIILFFLILSLNANPEKIESRSHLGYQVIYCLLLLGIISIMSLYLSKTITSEFYFGKSQSYLQKNEVQNSYAYLQKAIKVNPKVDRYHASFAQVDLAVAATLAQKTDLTDDERKTIAELVQHSINEGKITASLNSDNSDNWELLAKIYKSIIPLAEGSDGFAIQAFNEAIRLDPFNPNLRIGLGGTYYILQKYDEAVKAFNLAVTAKPDLANAHYNLGMAYKAKEDYVNAKKELDLTLSLLDENTKDYQIVLNELANLKDKNENSVTPPPTIESKEETENIISPESIDQLLEN